MSEMEIEDEPSGGAQALLDHEAREEKLDHDYPHRPRNHSKTLPFSSLFQDLFNPLLANQTTKQSNQGNKRRKLGPNSGKHQDSPQEVRRKIIERFISRWRAEVGDDIFPAFRLIVPEQDRERSMYGIKEKVLAKTLVKIMKIDRNSDDGIALINWKIPDQRQAGEFAGRCYEVIQKRPFRVDVGDMTVAEVNQRLDQLAAASREENQLPVLDEFYRRMNPEELMWLIRIILKQMKIGSTEKTILRLWHPDAHTLFNTTSSLRRVCWDLYSASVRLEGAEQGVTPMSCFQPQLAQFQTMTFDKIVERMRMTEDDPTFWIEEKLDGERMQMHMVPDKDKVGGRRFGFWSRKAKDYTYLYGNGLRDENGALTRYLDKAFQEGVESIILDGEMITWDPEQDAAVAFGRLKTAALGENSNPYAGKERPLFRVFDILYLNGHVLTQYTLRDRRNALGRSMIPVHRRFEIHEHKVASGVEDVEPILREVIARGEEGLVLKNPRSSYGLNERNDDWMKIKPEYMEEFGESLDCLVIGGYYGSGRLGGGLSSFLCGLRVDESHAKQGKYNPQKFWSFFKVGGGMTANDYATIKHSTEDKWHKWDSKSPPTEYIELGGADLQFEKPDVWIKPKDSVVIEAKAASVSTSEQFRYGMTLRFPRFKKLRNDKNWQSALSVTEFQELQAKTEQEHKNKAIKIDESRRASRKQRTIHEVKVVGYGTKDIQQAKHTGEISTVFENKDKNMTFHIMTESTKPEKKTKIELEEMVKAHGGKIVQSATAIPNTYCVAERRTIKVASLEKRGDTSILKPTWLFDCMKQNQRDLANGKPEVVVPEELERHFYFLAPGQEHRYEDHVDGYGDSYARDTGVEELKELLEKMGTVEKCPQSKMAAAIEDFHSLGREDLRGWIFANTKMYFDRPTAAQTNGITATFSAPSSNSAMGATTAAFAGALIAQNRGDQDITHIVVDRDSEVKQLRQDVSKRSKLPRIVTLDWIEESWKERTRLDEEKFLP